jgi:hypothetical protein
MNSVNGVQYVVFDHRKTTFRPGEFLLLNYKKRDDAFYCPGPNDNDWSLVSHDEEHFIDSSLNILALVISGPFNIGRVKSFGTISRYDVLITRFGLVFLFIYHKKTAFKAAATVELATLHGIDVLNAL